MIKTTNNKMAKLHIYQQLNLKNKLSKQEEQGQNHGYREHLMVAIWERCGGMGEEVRGLRTTNRQSQNSHGDVKYSIGNGVAEELIFMTRGYEQWWGDCLREWVVLGGGGQRGKNQDNFNSTINKIQ